MRAPARPLVSGLATALALLLQASAAPQAGAPDNPPKVAGSDVPAPKLKHSVAPEIPAAAEARGIGGIVIVSVIIDEEGRVASAEIVRGIPGLDQSALNAVRQWRFEVTRVDGEPVRVRHVVPVSFAHRLPRVTRADDVPELRQGVAPRFPDTDADEEGGLVALTLLVDENGHITTIGLESGTPPWTDAVLAAAQTWRFSAEAGRPSCPLRLEARFISKTREVDMRLARLSPETKQPDVESAEQSAEGALTATPTDTMEPAASASPSSAIISSTPSGPPVESEVIPSAVPLPSSTPPPPGISAVESVVLGPGVPDLILGRRPIVPPIARLDDLSGAIKIVFSVDVDGHASVHQIDGPEALRAAAEGVVRSWTFRPLTSERVFLIATITYEAESATAVATVGRRDLGLSR